MAYNAERCLAQISVIFIPNLIDHVDEIHWLMFQLPGILQRDRKHTQLTYAVVPIAKS